jgi:hypothetical protein
VQRFHIINLLSGPLIARAGKRPALNLCNLFGL